MRSSQLLSAVAFAAGATAIQNLLQIPQVAHDVRSMLDEFQKYTNYRGRTLRPLISKVVSDHS